MKIKALFICFLMLSMTGILLVLSEKTSVPKDYELNPVPETLSFTTEKDTINILRTSTEDKYMPLNYEYQKAMWFTVMDYQAILFNKSEEEFRSAVLDRFKKAADIGINTVYVHVRSNCDAYYNSKIFPYGVHFTAGGIFDPLEIITDIAHSLGLSVHAWINPLRGQTTEQMDLMSDSFIIKQWYKDEIKRNTYICEIEGRWYLNPAYSEARKLVADGAAEIARNYNIDGIHIDDYFYPTVAESFDAAAFNEASAEDLSLWRLENINRMVKEMYSTIKRENPDILFGISPQGSINMNYSTQYADVRRWASEKGFCDYIAPQLYYGFENESCPFIQTLDEWCALASEPSVKLVAGICTYKTGLEDKWAGKGAGEWINNADIASRQTEHIISDSRIKGIAIYSYASTLEDTGNAGINEIIAAERKKIREKLLKK